MAQYTLDSVQLVKTCLEQKYKGEVNQVIIDPHLCDLKGLTEYNKDTYYFGLVTVGNHTFDVKFGAYEDNAGTYINHDNILQVIPNNQATLLFQNVIASESPVANNIVIEGQFFGYQITLIR